MAKALLKKKDKPLKWYMKKADDIFSIWIRKRDSDWKGNITCITCFRTFPWEAVDNGHYISRRYRSVRYHEKNCHAQCKGCNGFNSGMTDVYALELIKRYGDDILNELNRLKNIDVHETRELYKNVIEKYK